MMYLVDCSVRTLKPARTSAPLNHHLRPSSTAHPSLRYQPRQPCSGLRHQVAGRRCTVAVRAGMMDMLTQRFERVWKLVSQEGTMTKDNIAAPLKEIKLALLEADVSLPVVRSFIKRVEEKALGKEVAVGLKPDEAFIKVVYEELVRLMGQQGAKTLNPGTPQVILMAGLQGVGKTTAAAKLARYLRRQDRSVLLVATDVYRPAAVEQLVKLGASIDVPVFELGTQVDPVQIARKGMEEARRMRADVVIIDTAGRLQVDTEMMAELKAIKAAVRPTDVLLVVDAMTGQEAASLVKTFNDEVDVTGAILTKMDGDSRGGAALCIYEVSGKPVKFQGVGETMDSLEPFYPERMASRLLGQGDIATLVEKTKAVVSEEDMQVSFERLMADKFDFNDFLKQWRHMKNMGGSKVVKMMPGFNQVTDKDLYLAEKKVNMFEAMVYHMDPEERENPELMISPVRRRRLAAAAGRTEAEVSTMLDEFNRMRAKQRQLAAVVRQGGAPADMQAALQNIASPGGPSAPGGADKAGKRKKERPAKPEKKGFGAAVASKK